MRMKTISIRYGEGMTLPVAVDDPDAVIAYMYVGLPGQSPVITVSTPLEDGVGTFVFEPNDTMVPLNTYKYQVNTEHADGYPEKYPRPEDCEEDGLPEFQVHEALDLTEVS